MKVLIVGKHCGSSNIAQALADKGHQVVVADPFLSGRTKQDKDLLNVIPIDLGDRQDVFEQVSKLTGVLGDLDVVVFAAANDFAVEADSSELSETRRSDEWPEMISSLLYGGFYCTQAALRHMTTKRSGNLVYLCADKAVDGRLQNASISASSCGLLALASTIASSAFRSGIKVNSLIVGKPYNLENNLESEPRRGKSNQLPYASKEFAEEQRIDTLRALQERSGAGWPESIAAMVEHLCSDTSGGISGSTLRLQNIGEQPGLPRWSY